jgi:hypothetical protein
MFGCGRALAFDVVTVTEYSLTLYAWSYAFAVIVCVPFEAVLVSKDQLYGGE